MYIGLIKARLDHGVISYKSLNANLEFTFGTFELYRLAFRKSVRVAFTKLNDDELSNRASKRPV